MRGKGGVGVGESECEFFYCGHAQCVIVCAVVTVIGNLFKFRFALSVSV